MNASKVGLLTPSSSDESINQLWHSYGKCPKGTIPIIRTKKEDVLRPDSIKGYGKRKKSIPVAQQSSVEPALTEVRKGHEYAHAQTDQGNYYGAQATFNIWNPKVQENNEFSLGQLWILGGPDSDLNTIEAGWHVFPELNGDTRTRLFIYWTNDGYQTTGCYNLKCSGFIQTNNEIAIGGSISPTSQVDGSQYEITILIWKDIKEGDWWMQYNGKTVGYWPASLFSYLSESASTIDFGGEVVNLGSGGQHTTTQMGSGYFPSEGFEKASYIRSIQTVNGSNTLTTPEILNAYVTQEGCYDILTGITDNWGSYFFYGGPGRNQNCP
ncbi:protein neprosin-like [Bidens hawaiensis]|uniref:protein neprosin-like n=1 Tax=Bidens hawaiensis TaxID=980011 RepID=UPI004049EBE1